MKVNGIRTPIVRLVEPTITSLKVSTDKITYSAEYSVNRECILVGYADRREASNVFKALAGLPDLDYSALIMQHGVISKKSQEFDLTKEEDVVLDFGFGGIHLKPGVTTEALKKILQNIVCVILE